MTVISGSGIVVDRIAAVSDVGVATIVISTVHTIDAIVIMMPIIMVGLFEVIAAFTIFIAEHRGSGEAIIMIQFFLIDDFVSIFFIIVSIMMVTMMAMVEIVRIHRGDIVSIINIIIIIIIIIEKFILDRGGLVEGRNCCQRRKAKRTGRAKRGVMT